MAATAERFRSSVYPVQAQSTLRCNSSDGGFFDGVPKRLEQSPLPDTESAATSVLRSTSVPGGRIAETPSCVSTSGTRNEAMLVSAAPQKNGRRGGGRMIQLCVGVGSRTTSDVLEEFPEGVSVSSWDSCQVEEIEKALAQTDEALFREYFDVAAHDAPTFRGCPIYRSTTYPATQHPPQVDSNNSDSRSLSVPAASSASVASYYGIYGACVDREPEVPVIGTSAPGLRSFSAIVLPTTEPVPCATRSHSDGEVFPRTRAHDSATLAQCSTDARFFFSPASATSLGTLDAFLPPDRVTFLPIVIKQQVVLACVCLLLFASGATFVVLGAYGAAVHPFFVDRPVCLGLVSWGVLLVAASVIVGILGKTVPEPRKRSRSAFLRIVSGTTSFRTRQGTQRLLPQKQRPTLQSSADAPTASSFAVPVVSVVV